MDEADAKRFIQQSRKRNRNYSIDSSSDNSSGLSDKKVGEENKAATHSGGAKQTSQEASNLRVLLAAFEALYGKLTPLFSWVGEADVHKFSSHAIYRHLIAH